MTDFAIIYPDGDGDAQRLAALLLSLADAPHDVVTNTDSGLGFRVPSYLGERYLEAVYPSQPPPDYLPADAPPARKRTRRKEAD